MNRLMKLKKAVLHYKIPGLCMALVFSGLAKAQFTNKLEDQFNQYGRKVLQEKVYLHTDRNFYIAGDIIWFKLYNVDASLHQPLDLSKVAYIEIINAGNAAVSQAKVGLSDGKGNGSIDLPVNFPTGTYKLRAYTNWMKNFGPDYFFEKTITVVNTRIKRETPATTAQPAPDIRFFPEGGNLVYSISSKIACKVTSPDGKGLDFEATIVDENNNTLASFNSVEYGMGSFDLKPLANHKYKAIIKTEKARIEKELPSIYKEGYVMHVTDGGQNLQVKLETNMANEGELYLLAHTRQSLKAVMKATVQNGVASFSVDKNKLGDGISGLTVFNTAKQPVCERLYFKYPEHELKIRVSGQQKTYPSRSKIDLDIQSTDENNIRAKADMSMAVYRLDNMQQVDEININAYLWLVSDLKGSIESPAYYFENITDKTKLAMDNLMLTQGWRRFKWEDILQDKTPAFAFAPEYNGHLVTGKVVHGGTGAAMKNEEIYMSAPGAGTHFLTSISDSTGRVKFDFKNLQGTTELVAQPSPIADTMLRVEISSPFSENYTSSPLPVLRLSKVNADLLLDHSIGTQVQNIYSGSQMKKFTSRVDTTSFYEAPDGTYYLDDYTRFTTMEEVLREYVIFLNVMKRKNKFSMELLNLDNEQVEYFGTDPLMLVDGVPVWDVDKLMTFDPLKMRKLEVVNHRYFLGRSFFPGIMNWQTYKADLAGYELDPRAIVVDYEGLQLEREFYSPVYDTEEKIASRLPDFRNVLYWSPSILTNEKGAQKVQFYSSDKKGTYIAVIQGMGANGRAGTGYLQFEVK
jgi:hypothetical protein